MARNGPVGRISDCAGTVPAPCPHSPSPVDLESFMSSSLPRGRRGGLSRSRGVAVAGASTAALLAFGLTAAPVSAAPVTVNPVSGNHGFLVMTEAEALLGGGRSEGPVAVGATLDFVDYSVATATAGSFVAPGDQQPSALVVGGAVGALGSVGELRVHNGGLVRIGDTGNAEVDNSGENTVISFAPVNDEPSRITLTTRQAEETVQGSPIDFAAAFAEYRTRSAALASCEPNVVPVDTDTDEPFGDSPMAERVAQLTLQPGRQNVWNVSDEDLSSLAGIEVGAVKPSADTPLVINVQTSADEFDTSFLVLPPVDGLGAAEAPYVLFNLSSAHGQLLLVSLGTFPGTLFAPDATVLAALADGMRGNVITQRFMTFLLPEEGEPAATEDFGEPEEFEEFLEIEEEVVTEVQEIPEFDNTLYHVPFAAEVELCGTEAPPAGNGDDDQETDEEEQEETGDGGTTPPPGDPDATASPAPRTEGPEAGGPTADKGLPVTGAGLVGLVTAAVAIVAAGAAALFLTRRRRST